MVLQKFGEALNSWLTRNRSSLISASGREGRTERVLRFRFPSYRNLWQPARPGTRAVRFSSRMRFLRFDRLVLRVYGAVLVDRSRNLAFATSLTGQLVLNPHGRPLRLIHIQFKPNRVNAQALHLYHFASHGRIVRGNQPLIASSIDFQHSPAFW